MTKGRVLEALGLPIYISEYDVDLSDDNQQQFPLFLNNSAVKGITLWGYQQNAIWKPNAYLVDGSGNERPALTWLKNYVATSNITCNPTATQNIVTDKTAGFIYPNPTLTGEFTINLPADTKDVNVLDMSGRIVKQVKLSGVTIANISIEGVPAGVYIVQIVNNRNYIYKKLIVK